MDEDYGTFSAAVDRVVTRAGRSPLREEIASLIRQVIRANQVLSDFAQDRSEIQLTMDAVPFVWNFTEDAPYFRKIEIARVMNRTGPHGRPLLFKKAPPGNLGLSGAIVANENRTYYRGGNVIAFGGHRVGDIIGVSYFSYLPPLHDFGDAIADRPWRYDLQNSVWVDQRTNFGQLPDGSRDPRSSSPIEASTNWLLFDWFELIVKGAMSNILNATADERGPRIFAEYKDARMDMLHGDLE